MKNKDNAIEVNGSDRVKGISSYGEVVFRHPSNIVFGNNSIDRFVTDFKDLKYNRLFVLSIFPLSDLVKEKLSVLKNLGVAVEADYSLTVEPSFDDFKQLLNKAKRFKADSVVGIGGGSVLDTAKLIAAMVENDQELDEIIGNGLLNKRSNYLACLPTTSGTGSEVSPNAIFFDTNAGGKKGVISSSLVPNAAYIDPVLTIGVPPSVTASTGLDALTHCIEAYVNNFSHPMCDLLALEGIRLIGANLKNAFLNGNDIEARSAMALGSVYGGMCLGPVNTAAVHALSYPLGSKFKIAHGLANAILLPYVLEYNLDAAIDKYESVAVALGAEKHEDNLQTARGGIKVIRDLINDCNIPSKLSELGIKKDDVEEMALSALQIQRLLKNNVKEVKLADAIDIYNKAC